MHVLKLFSPTWRVERELHHFIRWNVVAPLVELERANTRARSLAHLAVCVCVCTRACAGLSGAGAFFFIYSKIETHRLVINGINKRLVVTVQLLVSNGCG